MYLTEHGSWRVIDSTKINAYMTCPRGYFYEYILGWRPNPSNHLIFGRSWHKAMAYMLEHWGEISPMELIDGAYDEFITDYRAAYSEETDALYHPKSPAKAQEALIKYCVEYKADNFEVLHNEISGSVPIGEGEEEVLYFRVDAIIRDRRDGMVKLLEHKTGSRLTKSWEDQWGLALQVGTYLHVTQCLYDWNEVYGAIVSGTFFQLGEPKFKRVIVRKTPEAMQMWLTHAQGWLRLILKETRELQGDQGESHSDLPVMSCFPMRTVACTNYWGCPYMDYCKSWPNPLKKCFNVPIGMTQSFWDPREEEREAREIKHI